ncbi:MAG: TetR/AcrR family transcriptional regulator [Planctomycetota bacterium]
MRYAPDHKQATRERILEAAGRLFRREGFGGSGITAIMKEAGLTHGGFYAHFDDKEELLAAAIAWALSEENSHRSVGLEHLGGLEYVIAVCDRYLSLEHLEAIENGCPAPALMSELSRMGHKPREVFEEACRGWRDEIESHLDPDQHAVALGLVAACMGGLTLARSINDTQLREQVLASTRTLIRQSLADSNDRSAS